MCELCVILTLTEEPRECCDGSSPQCCDPTEKGETLGEVYHTIVNDPPHSTALGDYANILEEAQAAVYGPRQNDYGHPRDNFQQTADLWNAYFRGDEKPLVFTPEDIGVAMILVKVSRQSNSPKRDNLVDIAGYAATVDRVITGK